jgi:hypothetical protein
VALTRQDYSTGADRFQRALALVHAPTLLRDLARAQVGLGRLVDAHETYSLIIREGVWPRTRAALGEGACRRQGRDRADHAALPWITITVTGPRTPR